MTGTLPLCPARAQSTIVTLAGRAEKDVAPFRYLRFTAFTCTLCRCVLGKCSVVHGYRLAHRALRKLLWSFRFLPRVQPVVALVAQVHEARAPFVSLTCGDSYSAGVALDIFLLSRLLCECFRACDVVGEVEEVGQFPTFIVMYDGRGSVWWRRWWR